MNETATPLATTVQQLDAKTTFVINARIQYIIWTDL